MVSKTVKGAADSLDSMLLPRRSKFSPEEARSLLRIRLSPKANAKVQRLLRKNSRGTISAKEKQVLDSILLLGRLMDVIHAKAHYSLAK